MILCAAAVILAVKGNFRAAWTLLAVAWGLNTLAYWALQQQQKQKNQLRHPSDDPRRKALDDLIARAARN